MKKKVAAKYLVVLLITIAMLVMTACTGDDSKGTKDSNVSDTKASDDNTDDTTTDDSTTDGTTTGDTSGDGGQTDTGEESEDEMDNPQVITAKEAHEKMQDEDVIIVDVRTEDEYAEGHIPGAILIPNETIGDSMLEELPDKDAVILIYCRSGNRSAQAAKKLADMGYTSIFDFGGINDWPYAVE